MFVVVEGIDGAGTTSASKNVVSRLGEMNIPSLWTNEPSNEGPIGQLTRKALTGEIPLDKRAMLGLFIADRWWHVQHVIDPATAGGQIVVSDRYAYSTWVYQQDFWKPPILREVMAGLRAPDLVFILDCDVEVAQRRKSPEREMFDARPDQVRYRMRYQNLLAFNTFRLGEESIRVIDSQKHSKKDVADSIVGEILAKRRQPPWSIPLDPIGHDGG